MTAAIYIPTKAGNRVPLLRRAVAAVQRTGYDGPLYIATESSNIRDVSALLTDTGAEPLFIRGEPKGIVHARAKIIEHANRNGYDVAAMVDDDIAISGDVVGWLGLAHRPDVLGVGSYKSYYDWLFQGTRIVTGPKGLYMTRGGCGYIGQAMNVVRVLELGNYNTKFTQLEETELTRQSMWQLGIPWFIYTGVTVKEILSKKAMAKLGNLAAEREPGQISDRMLDIHTRLNKLWPAYTSAPPKRWRVSWKMLFRDCVSIPDIWPPENIHSAEPWDWEVN